MAKFYVPCVRVIVVSFCLLFTSRALAQQAASCPGFPNMVQKTVSGLNIATYFKGLLEYTPPGYNPAANQKYPLLIYFHGTGEVGQGSASDLCALLTPTQGFDITLPERIERGQVPQNAENQFIILSPQYDRYTYVSPDNPSNDYPSADAVRQMIDYALQHYDVDSSRIYLTGMSAGANMVIEYAAASQQNAELVAAIALSSLCSSVANSPNGPARIAAAGLPVWEVHCPSDATCNASIGTDWVNAINANSPPVPAKQTLLSGAFSCAAGQHNSWNALYDSTFVVDGANVFNWLLQYNRSALLPAGIKNYSAALRGNKVYVEWTTTAESNTDRFVLERAGSNMQYKQIASVMAAGASSSDKRYALVDDQPLKGANFYRLSLVNKDGKREYYDVKRVALPTSQSGSVNIPGPVKGTLSVYVNVERTQNVRISVHDLNGRNIHRANKLFMPGLSENKIDVSSLPSGTYLVVVEGQDFSVTRKVLIN